MAGKNRGKMEFDLAVISGRLKKDRRFALFASRKLTMRNMVLWPLISPSHPDTQTYTHTRAHRAV